VGGISVRGAHDLTGFAAADFSRVRQAKLGRFTIDRLMAMLNKLDQDVRVTVTLTSRMTDPGLGHPHPS